MAPTATTAYHHGNLRSALLAAAGEEIQRVGTAGLSLREVARRVGVSHAAPSHHFTDKRGLFTALAAEGYELLHQRTSLELASPKSLLLAGQRYVEFALDHPAHFAVMFEPALLDESDAELVRQRATAFDVLFQAVRDATGVSDEAEMVSQAYAAWAVVHGVATLWLAGNVGYPRDSGLVASVFAELGPALLPVAHATLG